MEPDLSGLDILFRLLAVLLLVAANGFFVASEFALVTVRRTRIDELVQEGHTLARAVKRALDDIDAYIAAAQLGITMASLGLGWIGEPALAALIEPLLGWLPGTIIATISAHTIAILIAFAIITSLHIVLGEQAPKTMSSRIERRPIVALPTKGSSQFSSRSLVLKSPRFIGPLSGSPRRRGIALRTRRRNSRCVAERAAECWRTKGEYP